MQNIAEIVEKDLCTGCGTCTGFCPNEAVEMRLRRGLWLPRIDNDRCNRCGLCLSVCPGYSVDFELLNSEVFGARSKDTLLGHSVDCYVGYSNNADIRYSSSSGGIISQLLVFALETNLIEGALVTRMNKHNPLESEPFIARTKEDIVSASKSKYCPVSVNKGLREIMKEDGRFAVVGLPCHIHGIRKAESINPELKKKIVLHIGLVCSHTVSFFGTDFLLEMKSVDKKNVAKLDYRGRGWPGSMSMHLRNGSSLTIPYLGGWSAYWPVFSSFFFTPWRCLMCPDASNELSDISVGDAYLPELKYDKAGQSILIARTRIAEEILHVMSSLRAISIKHIDFHRVETVQRPILQFKKVDLPTRLCLLNSIGKQTPCFNHTAVCSVSPPAFLRALFAIVNIYLSSSKNLRNLFVRLPLPVFRLYFGVYKLLSYL